MSDVYLWETYDRLGREALDRRDLNQAEEAFRSAVATAEEIESHDRLVLSLRNLAATLVEQGRVSDSYELLNRTLEVSNDSLGEFHSQTIETQRDLSRVCRDLGFLDKSEGYLKTILGHESRSGEPEQVSDTLVSLARLAVSRGNPQKAVSYYEQVVEVRTRQLGDEHPDVAQALLWLSTAMHQSGQAQSADAPMGVAFGILEKQFVDEPEQMAQSLMAGAQLMVESGQLEPALAHQKRALDLLSENLESEDPKVWDARELIATTLAGLGKVDESIELLEYCLRNRDSMEDHRRGAVLKNLGGLYLTTDKKEKAEELYREAAELLEKTLGPDHPAFLATQEERIQLYHFSGRSKEALDIALRCIKATEERFGAGHPNTAQTYASTALLAFNAEEWTTALELMRAAEKIWSSLSPRPEDVLANCRTNIATCLINLKKFKEAVAVLDQADETAGVSLKPVIANLREQLDVDQSKSEAVPVEEKESPEEAKSPDEGAASREPESSADPAEPVEEVIPDVPEVMPVEAEPEIDENSKIGAIPEVLPDVPPIPEVPEVPPTPESTIDYSIEDDEFALPDIDEFLASDEVPATEPASEGPSQMAAETESSSDEPTMRAVEVVFPDAEEEQEAVSLELEPEPEVEAASLEANAETDEGTDTNEESDTEVVAEEVAESTESENEVSDAEPAVGSEAVAEAEETETASQEKEEVETPPIREANSESKDFEERRVSPRMPLALNKFFDLKITHSSAQAEEVKSFLVDLGPGGIRINTESAFPSEGEVLLTLPEELLGEKTDMKAEVVWQKTLYGASYLQGLAFKELTSVQELLLGKRLKSDAGDSRKNSRQHFRLYRPFPIKLQPAGDDWVNSYATDLSVNGLGTRLSTQLETGDSLRIRLELEFELPTVEVEAKVAWAREGENGVTHGLQFSTVGPVEAKTIKRYIDRCLEFSPD